MRTHNRQPTAFNLLRRSNNYLTMITSEDKQHININGYDMAYYTAGDPAQPAVLLVHGWASHLGLWEGTIAALSEDFYCVAMDIVGYGDSDKPAGADYSIPSQAEQVVALADALGIGSFGLIGHSRGGQISLQIAAHTAPERVLALVDVAGPLTGKVGMYQRFALGPRIAIGRYVPALYNITHRLFRRSRRLAKLEFSPWFYDIDSVDEDDWWPDVQQATRPGTHVVNYKAGRAIQSHDLSEAIKAISAPTLVIFGEQDSCIPVEEGIMTAAGVPHARLKLLDACGHFPMYEQKDAYLHALHTFLCRHIGQAAST